MDDTKRTIKVNKETKWKYADKNLLQKINARAIMKKLW